MRSREVRLIARPEGAPRPADFELAEVDLPNPKPGQLLVRNEWLSLDPHQRRRMLDLADGSMPPFALGAVPAGRAVGEVIASEVPGFAVGDRILNHAGWREVALIDTGRDRAPERLDSNPGTPIQWYLGPLGASALTAYVGLFDVAEMRPDDVVYVSAAAGAVGGLAVQIAKVTGHTVIGSAGSTAKADFIRDELGADAAFSYRDGPVAELLGRSAPVGIDLYFDNVGGEHLEAALGALRTGGRVALCGAISNYNADGPAGAPSNLFAAVTKGLTLRGFMVAMYEKRTEDFRRQMREWLAAGKVVYPEAIFDGIEGVAPGFIAMLAGDTVGKALVRLDGRDLRTSTNYG
jgi:NADPH-dependent curcumin reductase CurA